MTCRVCGYVFALGCFEMMSNDYEHWCIALQNIEPARDTMKHRYSFMQPDWEAKVVSNAQLETVTYAMQRFTGEKLEDGSRAGFFLGDGAGVGKGRQIAAIIKEMWGRGTRRILWLSHCNDLREDARRDMSDMNINIPSKRDGRTNPRNPTIDVWPRGNTTPPTNFALGREMPEGGVLFATYSLLIAGAKMRADIKTKQGRKDMYAAPVHP